MMVIQAMVARALLLASLMPIVSAAHAGTSGCWSIQDPVAKKKCEGNSIKASDLGVDDIAPMHDTYEKNQARFFRNYRGKHFGGRLTVKGVSENPVFREKYKLAMNIPGTDTFMGDVACSITDKKTIDFITDLDKGDQVNVSGEVVDHTFGVVELERCTVARATDQTN